MRAACHSQPPLPKTFSQPVIDSHRKRASRDERSEVIRVQNRDHALPTPAFASARQERD